MCTTTHSLTPPPPPPRPGSYIADTRVVFTEPSGSEALGTAAASMAHALTTADMSSIAAGTATLNVDVGDHGGKHAITHHQRLQKLKVDEFREISPPSLVVLKFEEFRENTPPPPPPSPLLWFSSLKNLTRTPRPLPLSYGSQV